MPIINGTTMRKIASLFILAVSGRLYGVFIYKTEISHGRVLWQGCSRSLDQGPLASSIGQAYPTYCVD